MNPQHFLVLGVILTLLWPGNCDVKSNSIYRNTESNYKNTQNANMQNSINLIEQLRKQIKTKEEELHKAEVVNKNFERMIQLVNILGQVDNFLTDRTKTMIKKLAVLADDESAFNS